MSAAPAYCQGGQRAARLFPSSEPRGTQQRQKLSAARAPLLPCPASPPLACPPRGHGHPSTAPSRAAPSSAGAQRLRGSGRPGLPAAGRRRLGRVSAATALPVFAAPPVARLLAGTRRHPPAVSHPTAGLGAPQNPARSPPCRGALNRTQPLSPCFLSYPQGYHENQLVNAYEVWGRCKNTSKCSR